MKRIVLVNISALISVMRKNFRESAKCAAILLIVAGFFSCEKWLYQSKEDKVKNVDMTIYPETWPILPVLSDIWLDALVFSESDDNQKRPFSSYIKEGFDFDYERGYEYTFKAKKVWMSDPPMDVASVKYIFAGSLTKKRVILENNEEEIELFVLSELVKYCPTFPIEYENDIPKHYNALLCIDRKTNRNYVLKEIEGFNHESGYEYTLSIKKMIQAQPYSERYVLLDIKDKKSK